MTNYIRLTRDNYDEDLRIDIFIKHIVWLSAIKDPGGDVCTEIGMVGGCKVEVKERINEIESMLEEATK